MPFTKQHENILDKDHFIIETETLVNHNEIDKFHSHIKAWLHTMKCDSVRLTYSAVDESNYLYYVKFIFLDEHHRDTWFDLLDRGITPNDKG